jgi:hypothetical protein
MAQEIVAHFPAAEGRMSPLDCPVCGCPQEDWEPEDIGMLLCPLCVNTLMVRAEKAPEDN